MSVKKPTKRQHFVPQWYLRQFSAGGVVHVFDKVTGKAFTASPANVALEKNFYTLPIDRPDEEPVAEEILRAIEARCAKAHTAVVNRIAYRASQRDSKVFVRPDERELLALNLVLQTLRTPLARKGLTDGAAGLHAWMQRFFRGEDVDLDAYDPAKSEVDENTRHVAMMLSDRTAVAAQIVANYSFVFMYSDGSHPLFASDDPVHRFDLTDMETVKLPFAVMDRPAGHEVRRFVPKTAYLFPMSTRVLLMVGGGRDGGLWPDFDGRIVVLDEPREIAGDQVLGCRRQVYCEREEFDVAREIVANNPDCVDPSRTVVQVGGIDEMYAAAEARSRRRPRVQRPLRLLR